MKAYHARWPLGVIPLIAGYVGSKMLSHPPNEDYRSGAWMMPIGAGIGSVLLLWQKKGEKVSLLLKALGLACAVVAILYAGFHLVFDAWMHGM